MSFAAPLNLLAAVVVPLLAAAYVIARRRRRRYAVRFPAVGVLAAVVARAPAWRRRLPLALLACGALTAAVAMARPHATVSVPVERASVVLVTDKSGSMAANDVSPTRVDAARGAAERFLDDVPDSLLVGFVSYASATETNVAPATDRAEVGAALDALTADGGTATGDALTAALDQLAARKDRDGRMAPAAVVLLSDGKTTEGGDPLEAAAHARELGVPVYTVALGTAAGTVTDPQTGQEISVAPDPETLRAIAERSGGQAFEVDDADELDGVYQRLGSQIGTRRERREITSAFAGGALLLLFGGVGTGLRWRGRFP